MCSDSQWRYSVKQISRLVRRSSSLEQGNGEWICIRLCVRGDSKSCKNKQTGIAGVSTREVYGIGVALRSQSRLQLQIARCIKYRKLSACIYPGYRREMPTNRLFRLNMSWCKSDQEINPIYIQLSHSVPRRNQLTGFQATFSQPQPDHSALEVVLHYPRKNS